MYDSKTDSDLLRSKRFWALYWEDEGERRPDRTKDDVLIRHNPYLLRCWSEMGKGDRMELGTPKGRRLATPQADWKAIQEGLLEAAAPEAGDYWLTLKAADERAARAETASFAQACAAWAAVQRTLLGLEEERQNGGCCYDCLMSYTQSRIYEAGWATALRWVESYCADRQDWSMTNQDAAFGLLWDAMPLRAMTDEVLAQRLDEIESGRA